MNIIEHMKYFQSHHTAYLEVMDALEQIKDDYKTDSNENIAKVVSNMLSEETSTFYDVDFLLKAFAFGMHKLPIALAIQDTEQLIKNTYNKWEQFSWFNKLILGFKPNRKGAAEWILASQFNTKSMKSYNKLNETEKEIVRLIYGNVLTISNKKG